MQELPRHLIQLLKTSKYLHLATASKDGIPSVSLMNYTYIPSDNDQNTEHYVVFSTASNTEKYQNILANPVVSLLIHDWMTAKKLSLLKSSLSPSASRGNEDYESESGGSSSLFNLLHDLNQAELSQMSATMRGLAQVIDPASKEFHIYKTALLKANPDAECFIQGDNTAIIRVQLERAKISDSDNNTSVYQ